MPELPKGRDKCFFFLDTYIKYIQFGFLFCFISGVLGKKKKKIVRLTLIF